MAFYNAIDTIAYNGYTFNERTQTEQIVGKPIPDASGRTFKYILYSITLRTIINTPTGDANLDATMAPIRRKLLARGKSFIYKNAGFGALNINVTDAATDVAWGPNPQELSYKPLGIKAAELLWKVDVAIPECSSAVYRKALMEFAYKLSFEQDRAGFTTRTYRGYYSIPMTRKIDGSRSLPDSADNYWEDVIPVLPDGFRREVTQRELDESKARMDFVIVDSEMPINILPEGIIECKAGHSLESTDRGFFSWVGNFTADYELARDYPQEKVFQHFIRLVQQRVDAMIANLKPLATNVSKQWNLPADSFKGYVLPTRFSMAEPDIYGRPQAKFSFQYLMYQPFKNILASSAMWLPVDNDWTKWKTSLSNTALHPRGNAKLKFNPQDDVIMDLCLNRRDITLATSSNNPGDRTLRAVEDICGPCPAPKDSWIFYDVQFETERNDATMVHKPLPQTTPTDSMTLSEIVAEADDIIQKRTTKTNVIWVVGKALRVCFDIPEPTLTKIGSVEVVSANRQGHEYFRQYKLGDFGCHSLIAAEWRHRYIVPAKKNVPSFKTLRTVGTQTGPRLDTTSPFPTDAPTLKTVG